MQFRDCGQNDHGLFSLAVEETMQYFKKVKGVTNVEYDHIIRLTDPVKPKLEIK